MPVRELKGRTKLPELMLEHGDARVRLALQGAHITEYTVGNTELLWISESARFAEGVSIRGGIPLCWPWFGASLDDPDWPQHGFARVAQFRLLSKESSSNYATAVLALDSLAPVPEWAGVASLEVEIRLSDHLWMELRTTNRSDRDLLLGAGLHSYFQVSACDEISMPALTGLAFVDMTAGFERAKQTEALEITDEVDRVYLGPPRIVELFDSGRSRKIEIDAWGNTDLVVWNPGPRVAASMEDFDDYGYQRMVCIEPAIALENRVRLQPGARHAIGQTIKCIHG
ncbi:MAG: D-hexose-6-phosphate mutarotase [Pseudomonadota bacterium]